MNKFKQASISLLAICLYASSLDASIDFTAGCWDLSFSGYVDGFYTYSICQGQERIYGGLACTSGRHENALRSGFVPPALIFNAKTKQRCYDIGITFGMYPGINNEERLGVNGTTGNVALGSGSLDFRQIFMTIGNDSMGTVKIGRDIGIFGRNAILYDMTFIGVGGNMSVAAPENTSLGRIGLGYIYADWMAQISYESPDYNGFKWYCGIFQPLNAVSSLKNSEDPTSLVSGIASHHSSPQVQVGVDYEWEQTLPSCESTLKTEVWADFIYQHQGKRNNDGEHGFDAFGFDAGTKINFDSFEIVGYGYWGKGLGTTGYFIDAISLSGKRRSSYGGYIQGIYNYCNTKFGLSWGASALSHEHRDSNHLVKRNEAVIFGIYHSLTKSVQLCSEYVYVRAVNHEGGENHENTLVAGAFLTF